MKHVYSKSIKSFYLLLNVIHIVIYTLFSRCLEEFPPSPDMSVSLWDLSGFTKMIHLVEHMLSIESSFAVEFRNVVM